jgi:hypothetical protein
VYAPAEWAETSLVKICTLWFRQISWSLERQFDEADVALYNVMEDPAEKTDLSTVLPEVFRALRQGQHLPDQGMRLHLNVFSKTVHNTSYFAKFSTIA